MPQEVAKHQRKKLYLHNPTMDADDDEESLMILPSYSQIVIDDQCQASIESILSETEKGRVLPFVVAPSPASHKTHRSCLPSIVDKPPELIRGFILTKGESYWKTTVKAARVLATFSFIQLVIYIMVYALMGHIRIVLALLPIRNTVILWFLTMFGLDILVLIIVQLGHCVDIKFESSKRIDMYVILIATMVLIAGFLISAAYPVYATPNLVTRVRGTIIQNDTVCMSARDHCMQTGTTWDAIPKLRAICEKDILCVENCRDFRLMYTWFYATYILTILRLFVLITLWDICSFLCVVMDLREENITYTVNLRGGYHM